MISETADWTITTTEGGSGDATEAITDETGGVLLITNDDGGSDRDELQLVGESFKPQVGKRIYYETRVKFDDVSLALGTMGLIVTDTSMIVGSSDSFQFRKEAADTAIDFGCWASSSSTIELDVGTVADATYITLGFRVVGTGLCEAWVKQCKESHDHHKYPDDRAAS